MVVKLYLAQLLQKHTFIAATNDSTGSHFIVGGDGALYTVNLNTALFADGNYSLFANSSVTENDTSDQTFTISNAVGGGGGGDTSTGGGDESGGGRDGGDEIPDPKDFGIGIIPLIPEDEEEAAADPFESQPVKSVEVAFSNTGVDTIRNIELRVGITPEEVTKVIGDLDTLELKFDDFTVSINDLFDNCDNASDETVADIHSKADEIKIKFNDLKTNLLAALKVGSIGSQEEVDKLNAQIDDLKSDIHEFTARLQKAYDEGKLCSISELFILQRLLVNMIEGFELLKADVLKALKVSVLGSAEPYLPLYPVKTIVTCVGAFEVTLLPVSDRLLTPQLLEPIVVDKLEPGETLKKKVKIKMPMTARENVSIDVIYTTYGQEVGKERVSFDLVPKIAASAVHVEGNVVDLYAVISELPGNLSTTRGTQLPVDKQAPIPEQLDPYLGEDITVEIGVIKNASTLYNPTLRLRGLIESLIRGPTTPFSEILGPYPLKPGERFLLAQQFRYDPAFAGNYQLEFTFRRGNEFIARQRHELPLACAGGDCVEESICTINDKPSTPFVRVFGFWLLILIIIAIITTYIIARHYRQPVVVQVKKEEKENSPPRQQHPIKKRKLRKLEIKKQTYSREVKEIERKLRELEKNTKPKRNL